MSVTALDMRRLDDEARAMASKQCQGYLADARQCLRDTGDPIVSLELLQAMWTAARRDQKAALQDAGQWLEDRLRREPALPAHQLELELGWLHRLISVHGVARAERDRDSGPTPPEPAFGAHIPALRHKRAQALQRAAADHQSTHGRQPAHADTPRATRPQHLPEAFEACFASWVEAVDAFKTARKRSKQNKPPKDRLLAVKPAQAELQPLATDISCSMLRTQGMDELQARALTGAELPGFWIFVADLVTHDGKRLAARIWFSAGRPDECVAPAPDE